MLEIEKKEAIRELNDLYNSLNVLDELLDAKQKIFLEIVDEINSSLTLEEITTLKHNGFIRLGSLPRKDDFANIKYEAINLVKSYLGSVSIDEEDLLFNLFDIIESIRNAKTKEEVSELLRKALMISSRAPVKKESKNLDEEIKKSK